MTFNDIGFDQLPKFKVPARFLATSPGAREVGPIVDVAGTSAGNPSSTSNNKILPYLIGGIFLILIGYKIFVGNKDSKTEKTKTKRLDV